MKIITMKKIYSIAIIALASTFSTLKMYSQDSTQAQLKARAKITEVQAREIASAKVPTGVIKTAELEEENGKLIYSFDISSPGTANITEIAVDAITGAVVGDSIETPKDQAKEVKEDMAAEEKVKAQSKKY